MHRCGIVQSFGSRPAKRAHPRTPAALEYTKFIPARAGHGGPAGASRAHGRVVAPVRLAFHLRPDLAQLGRVVANTLAYSGIQALGAQPRECTSRMRLPYRVFRLSRYPYTPLALSSAQSLRPAVPHVRNILVTYFPTAPNPSVKRSANGRPPSPGRWYAVHFHRPGLGVLPSAPAYLER